MDELAAFHFGELDKQMLLQVCRQLVLLHVLNVRVRIAVLSNRRVSQDNDSDPIS